MFDGSLRSQVDKVTSPVGKKLASLPISPNQLTVAGVIFSMLTCVAIGLGHLGFAVVGIVLAGLCDLLDGPLAKSKNCSSLRGAFLDSVADRVSDTLLLSGFGWYLTTRYGGHWAMLPMAILGVTVLVSYQRAKAESFGLCAKGGIMERAERVVVLALALLISSFMLELLWLVLVLTSYTALVRFVKVFGQAGLVGLADINAQERGDSQAKESPDKIFARVREPKQRVSSITSWRTRHAQGGPSRWRSRRAGELTRNRTRRVRSSAKLGERRTYSSSKLGQRRTHSSTKLGQRRTH